MPAPANDSQAFSPPRLVVAGTHSGCGKTTASIALMAAFLRKGLAVHPFKVGPDYIDPSFHEFVTGRPSYSLDTWLLDEETVKRLFLRHAPPLARSGQALGVIEGVMGLFDGQALRCSGSTAHVAQTLRAPVLLVVDGQGMSLSAAALVSGYASFRPGCSLSGVVFNRLSGDKHYRLLADIVEGETGVPCFGYLSRNPKITLKRRHLGLVPGNEVENLARLVTLLAEDAESTVDLDGLLRLASGAPALHGSSDACSTVGSGVAPSATRSAGASSARPRIGVCKDNAFSFYYRDNLELLEACGADLAFISPMRDAALPRGLAGLYLGGGFPEVFAGELSANDTFRTSLREALEAGLPAYAECGGLMYLMEGIETLDGEFHPMAGFFSGKAVMTKRLGPFGYVTVELLRDSILGPAGTRTRAHEFHHSRLECSGDCAAVSTKENGESWKGGLVRKNTLAWYPHLHFHTAPELAYSFVAACRAWISGNRLQVHS